FGPVPEGLRVEVAGRSANTGLVPGQADKAVACEVSAERRAGPAVRAVPRPRAENEGHGQMAARPARVVEAPGQEVVPVAKLDFFDRHFLPGRLLLRFRLPGRSPIASAERTRHETRDEEPRRNWPGPHERLVLVEGRRGAELQPTPPGSSLA